MDLPNAKENLEALRERFPKISILPVAAEKSEGIDRLKEMLGKEMTDDKSVILAGN